MATRKTTSRTTKTTTASASKSTAASTAKPATAKPAAAKAPTTKAASKPAQAPVTKTPKPAAAGAKPAETAALRKKELLARVKARSAGVKGSDVRLVMDAVLEEIGALLVEGKALNAQPLGVLKVQKRKPISGADIVVCKLRRKKRDGDDKDPLAEAAE